MLRDWDYVLQSLATMEGFELGSKISRAMKSTLINKSTNINQSRRTDAEAEAPVLWPPDEKSWLTGKDPDARKNWRQEEKGTTEHEMVGWHHQLNGLEFEQTPRDGEGQGSLVSCSLQLQRVRHNLVTEQQQWFGTYGLERGNNYTKQSQL